MSKQEHAKHHVPHIVAKRGMILTLVFTILFATSVITSIYYRYKYETNKNVLHTYALKTWAAGDIVVDDRFAFSFNSARSDTTDIPHFWELAPDEKFVIVDVSFMNRANTDFQLSPISLMHLEDS